MADVVVHLGWKEEKAFRKITALWFGAGDEGRMARRRGREGERGLWVVFFASSKGQAKAWVLQYQCWTAEGNMSLRMLNLQPRAGRRKQFDSGSRYFVAIERERLKCREGGCCHFSAWMVHSSSCFSGPILEPPVCGRALTFAKS